MPPTLQQCICDVGGWIGPTCRENPCASVDCGAHGDCTANPVTKATVCVCKDGYVGAKCDMQWLTRSIVSPEGGSVGTMMGFTSVTQCATECEKIDTCRSFTFGGGQCYFKDKCVLASDPGNAGSSFKTAYRLCSADGTLPKCKAGFAGPKCDVETCTWLKCGAKGTCDVGKVKCVCEPGWGGATCEEPSPCASIACGAHGTCVVGAGNAVSCSCTDGYTGETCNVQWITRSLVTNEGGSVGEAMPLKSVSLCAAECEKHDTCRSFAYNNPGMCYFKDRCVAASDPGNAGSAFKTAYRPCAADGTLPPPPNADCAGSWSEWSSCNATTKSRAKFYIVSASPSGSGKVCPASPSSEACVPEEVNVDCSGTWSSWSTCDATTKTRSQFFTVSIAQKGSGKACPASPASEACVPEEVNVDCSGTWSSWSTCDAATKTRSQSFTLLVAQKGSGKACPVSPASKACIPGEASVDCSGTWSSWSTCDAATMTRSQSFTLLVAQKGGGKACPVSPSSEACVPSGGVGTVGNANTDGNAGSGSSNINTGNTTGNTDATGNTDGGSTVGAFPLVAVAGGAGGGVVLIIIVAVVAVVLMKRRKNGTGEGKGAQRRGSLELKQVQAIESSATEGGKRDSLPQVFFDNPMPPTNSLPAGWQAVADMETGGTYYHNAASGESTWEFPVA